jgi:hypothetical protein
MIGTVPLVVEAARPIRVGAGPNSNPRVAATRRRHPDALDRRLSVGEVPETDRHRSVVMLLLRFFDIGAGIAAHNLLVGEDAGGGWPAASATRVGGGVAEPRSGSLYQPRHDSAIEGGRAGNRAP